MLDVSIDHLHLTVNRDLVVIVIAVVLLARLSFPWLLPIRRRYRSYAKHSRNGPANGGQAGKNERPRTNDVEEPDVSLSA